MCPPKFYGVRYDINPWMSRNLGDDTPCAQRQWERLVELLSVAGDVTIEMMEPRSESPDQVFTANAGLICDSLAIMSTFRHPERRAEQAPYRSWLARQGFATTTLPECYFEGAGDALFDRVRPQMYVGYGFRTDRAAALWLAEFVDVRVIALRLVDERFYHLDSALCPLGSGHVLFYPDAFAPDAQRTIRATVEADSLIEVSREDALAFACSPIEVGDALIMGEHSRMLRSRLSFAGYRVFSTDLSEFAKAGGSAKALTLRLNDGPACGVVAA